MTKRIRYYEEELEILQAIEAGQLKLVTGAEKRAKSHQAAAETTFKKDQRLNIRLSSRDLKNLQARAAEEGIPYQTLAASLVHKYVLGCRSPHAEPDDSNRQ